MPKTSVWQRRQKENMKRAQMKAHLSTKRKKQKPAKATAALLCCASEGRLWRRLKGCEKLCLKLKQRRRRRGLLLKKRHLKLNMTSSEASEELFWRRRRIREGSDISSSEREEVSQCYRKCLSLKLNQKKRRPYCQAENKAPLAANGVKAVLCLWPWRRKYRRRRKQKEKRRRRRNCNGQKSINMPVTSPLSRHQLYVRLPLGILEEAGETGRRNREKHKRRRIRRLSSESRGCRRLHIEKMRRGSYSFLWWLNLKRRKKSTCYSFNEEKWLKPHDTELISTVFSRLWWPHSISEKTLLLHPEKPQRGYSEKWWEKAERGYLERNNEEEKYLNEEKMSEEEKKRRENTIVKRRREIQYLEEKL